MSHLTQTFLFSLSCFSSSFFYSSIRFRCTHMYIFFCYFISCGESFAYHLAQVPTDSLLFDLLFVLILRSAASLANANILKMRPQATGFYKTIVQVSHSGKKNTLFIFSKQRPYRRCGSTYGGERYAKFVVTQ